MPNQTMNRGTRASSGKVRSIWIGGSSRTSPQRLRPAISASTTPVVTPTVKPTATRPRETSRFWISSPDASIWAAVTATVEGAASTLAGISPDRDPTSQSSSSSRGDSQRGRPKLHRGSLAVALFLIAASETVTLNALIIPSNTMGFEGERRLRQTSIPYARL